MISFVVQDLDGDIIETENPKMIRTSPIRECSKSVEKKGRSPKKIEKKTS